MSVYFAERESDGLIKIGHSRDVDHRIAALMASERQPIKLLRVIDGGFASEKEMHRRFAEQRVHGEWFTFHEDMMRADASTESVSHGKVREAWRVQKDREYRDWVISKWRAAGRHWTVKPSEIRPELAE